MSRSSKKFLGAAALTATLAGGGIAGALLGSPTTSGAQSETTTTTTEATSGSTTEPKDRLDRLDRPGFHRGGAALEAAATALGISLDDLRTELEADKTIAEVAEGKGVDVATVIDAMIAAETKEIDEQAAERKANLESRITDLVNEGGPRFGPGGHGPGGFGPGGFDGHRGVGVGLDVAADALGLTMDELRTRIEADDTLAEIAKAEGVDPQKVIDAMVAEAATRIDEAVADGRLTAAEATDRKAEIKTEITRIVNEGGPRFRPHR